MLARSEVGIGWSKFNRRQHQVLGSKGKLNDLVSDKSRERLSFDATLGGLAQLHFVAVRGGLLPFTTVRPSASQSIMPPR